MVNHDKILAKYSVIVYNVNLHNVNLHYKQQK
jgi:hypothetical protein